MPFCARHVPPYADARATSLSASQQARLKLREEAQAPVDMRTVRAEVSPDNVVIGNWIKPIGLACASRR